MAIFFAAALVAYTPGIWWGLPDATAPGRDRPWGTDELGPVGAINELYGVLAAHRPTFNPQYPLFHYVCQFIFVAPYYAGLWLTGHLSYPAPNFPFGLDHPPLELGVMTLLARFVSLLMAAGVVAVAFRTGEVLRGRRTGMLAALFVLLQYPMFYYARTSNVDMGALFWTALGLWMFALCLTSGVTMRRGIALGIFAALAIATKDPSYAVFVPVGLVFLVLHIAAMRREGRGGFEIYRVPAYTLAVAVLVYVVSSGLVLRPSRYFRHIYYITHGSSPASRIFYFRYPATAEGYLTLGREVVTQLEDAMGLPMLLCATAGLAVWIARDRRLLLWVLPAAGIVVGVILPVRFVLLRFVLIIGYVLAFCAADFLARGLERTRATRRLIAQVAIVIVAAWSGLRGTDLTYQMLHDSRHIAARWLAGPLRQGDVVGHIAPASTLPHLAASVGITTLTPGRLAALSAANGPEFIISLPLEDYEQVHEEQLPEDVYQQLLAGTRGYRQAALIQAPSLFRKRPATFVNPPVRIFIRDDLWQSRIRVNPR